MVYVDTSVLVAYYSPEKLSERAEKFLLGQDRVAISSLTESLPTGPGLDRTF